MFKKKAKSAMFTCDIGVLSTNIDFKKISNASKLLLDNINSSNINIVGLGDISIINSKAFNYIYQFYLDNKNKYQNIQKIYPTITCILFDIVKPGNVLAKIILNTYDPNKINKIDKYCLTLYKKAKINCDKYIFNRKTFYKFLKFLNDSLDLAIEIWAFYDNKFLVSQIESKDILKIPENFLSHCFHKFLRFKLTLGSNCNNWKYYPYNSLAEKTENKYWKFYYLLENNDLFV